MNKTTISLGLALCLSILLVSCSALWAYNNTSLDWRTITTEHFEVHYHQGEEWTAREVARVAEEVHPYLTAVYNYEPKDKVHFIIKDTDDYANGATYYFDNKIEIWATNLEFGFRGTTKWIQNVVIHEYAHMISLHVGFKFGGHVPALYFQMIDFEKEKRPDVLTGYPNRILSYPFAGSITPNWFAEGVAQYQSPQKHYDCWDTHRDMILRCAVLEDKMLTYDEMGFFGHTSMGNEQVYDHGFGLVSYIVERYGPETLQEIMRNMSSVYRLSFDSAIKKAVGIDGRQLYGDWTNWMRQRYSKQAAEIEAHLCAGRELSRAGYMTIEPAWNSDGETVVFLSNKKSDFSGTSLYRIARDGTEMKRLKGGVDSRAVFSPDGTRLVYARKRKMDRFGSVQNDLYLYDIATKKEKRLTNKLRASSPQFSPDASQIVCVLNQDGTHRIALMDIDGGNLRVIYGEEKGTQLYSPQFSADGSRILFGIFEGSNRNIAMVASDGSGFHYLLDTPHDERDARCLPDGSGIVFASDRNGVFNIYSLDFETDRITQLTNVIGGAFMPDISPVDGALVYSRYAAYGYGIDIMDNIEPVFPAMPRGEYARYEGEHAIACGFLKNPGAGTGIAGGTRAANSLELPDAKYKPTFTPFQYYPSFILYDRNPRFGLLIAGNEILEKQSILLSASVGTNKEFDAYASYEMRYLYPTLFASIVRVREYFDDLGIVPEDPAYSHERWDLGLRYDLWEFDVGLRFELSDPYSLTFRNEISLFFTHGEYSVHLDPRVFDTRDQKWSLYSPVGWKYYIGNEITARHRFKSIARAVDSDINPRGGREFTLEYVRSMNKLFSSGEFDYGLRPSFDTNYFNQYSLEWIEYVALPFWRHSLQLRLYGAAIDRKVDDFFYIYVGGLDYLRGYTYYSIGGRKAVLGSATYRFPVWRNINKQLLHLTFRDIYAGAFYEAGTAWNNDKVPTTGYRKTIGGELRVFMGSFYAYPTALEVISAYSLDEFSYRPTSVEIPVVHEKGWSTYVTLGFQF